MCISVPLNMKRSLQGRMQNKLHPNILNVESEHQNKLLAFRFRRIAPL